MKKYLLYMILIIMVAFAAASVFAQDEGGKAVPKEGADQGVSVQQTPAAAPVVETPKISELSIYGEVQNINIQANSMVVQYYDYDNDEEKSIEIALDSSSKLENASGLGDVKKGDWVDVTYTANAGKNIAKIVSVEKEEPAQEENAPVVEE